MKKSLAAFGSVEQGVDGSRRAATATMVEYQQQSAGTRNKAMAGYHAATAGTSANKTTMERTIKATIPVSRRSQDIGGK
ncbi:hypothetical protein OUZ56_030255 [Daphnia magna]|uniref:Uncharacterized protein n=1 Tax=Daphnia magna TaxID=35525 RepID=A0ABQ9ZQR1_9CRUS|nr:hypothetical protein OUZ56_030255 [Daphnia magna]